MLGDGLRVVLAPNPGLMTGPGTNQYLLGVDGEAPLLMDAAVLDDENTRRLADATSELAGMILTHVHPDHVGGVSALRARFGITLAMHRSRADFLIDGRPMAPEQPLDDGDIVDYPGGSLMAVHTPGHESGHLCYFEPERRWLFTGDTILSTGTTVIAPPDGDMAAYLASLARLRTLGATRIFPGHGPPITDPDGAITEYIEHRELRERQVLEQLAHGTSVPEAMVPEIYPTLAPGLAWAAAATVRAHLAKLVSEGRARITADGRFVPG